MPRIRSIKPELPEDEKLGSVPIEARWLFVALITQADDHGNMRGSAGYIRSRAFPHDDVTTTAVEDWIQALSAIGVVLLYHVNGERFLHLVGWEKHQLVKNPAKFYPIPDPSSGDPTETLRTSSGDPTETLPLARASDLGPRTGDLGAKRAPNGALSTSAGPKPDDVVFEHWKLTRQRPGAAKFTDDRKRLVKARLREKYTPEDLCKAIDGMMVTPHNLGDNDRGERFDDLVHACASGKNVDRFMRNADNPPKPRTSTGYQTASEKARDKGTPVLQPDGTWVDGYGALCMSPDERAEMVKGWEAPK